MLLTGISVGSPLSIWDNLRYLQDKVCCVGIELFVSYSLCSFYMSYKFVTQSSKRCRLETFLNDIEVVKFINCITGSLYIAVHTILGRDTTVPLVDSQFPSETHLAISPIESAIWTPPDDTCDRWSPFSSLSMAVLGGRVISTIQRYSIIFRHKTKIAPIALFKRSLWLRFVWTLTRYKLHSVFLLVGNER